MSILIQLPNKLGMSGAPRRLITLAGALYQRNVPVVVLCRENSDAHHLLRKSGVPCEAHRASDSLLIDLVQANRQAALVARNYKCSHVIVRGPIGAARGFLGLRSMRVKRILDLDYTQSFGFLLVMASWVAAIMASKIISQYRDATSIFAQLPGRGRIQKKTTVLIPGIDLDRARKWRGLRNEIKRAATVRFLIAASIHPRKDQKRALELLIDLAKNDPKRAFYVDLCGAAVDKRYFQEVFRVALKAPANLEVNFNGWIGDLDNFIQAADFLLITSKDEGVPNIAQEAMAAGLPVIAVPSGGISEVIQSGHNGWLIEGGSINELVDGISDEKYRKVARQAINYAERNFNSLRWADAYLAAITSDSS